MAEIAKSGTPSIATVNPCSAHRLTGLLAGEAIAAGDACRIHTDGKVYKATGAAADASARVNGWAAGAAASGESVTLYHDVNYHYGAALVPGTPYYLSGTVAGGIADAASTGGTVPIAFAMDATRIHVLLDPV